MFFCLGSGLRREPLSLSRVRRERPWGGAWVWGTL